MVRRRQRAVKSAPVENELFNGQKLVGNVLDEQYFASPKRKDCKIEKTVDKAENMLSFSKKTNNRNATGKLKQERSAERIIGVPLATRSQTRTIEHFFKASAKLRAATTVNSHSDSMEKSLDHLENETACFYDLCEDTTNDTDGSDEAHLRFDIQHNNNHIDNDYKLFADCDNIFLQKPVLKLEVDETLRHMPISNGLELEPIFSSPSSLNGRFNKIVSITAQAANLLPENDNSSCDSGVAFSGSSTGNDSPPHTATTASTTLLNRRRKPTTPHRILCPSPVKSMPVHVSPLTKKPIGTSPRKSPRQSATTNNQNHAIVTSVNSKTRKRLNHQYQPINMFLTKESTDEHKESLLTLDIESDEDKKPVIVKEEEPDVPILNNLKTETEFTAKKELPVEVKLEEANKTIKTDIKPKLKSKMNKMSKKKEFALPTAATGNNRKMCEIFPVRRSVRKTKSAVKEEMMRSLEQAILEQREDGLRIEYFEGKGRGIITTRPFMRGEFVVEYAGDLISMNEAAEREKQYALDENAGCYMYYFKHKNQQYCIDATADTGKFGRLINHSRTGNLMTKVLVIKQRPHLILIAKDDIAAGEELCYDYGDRSKESLLHHPWLAF